MTINKISKKGLQIKTLKDLYIFPEKIDSENSIILEKKVQLEKNLMDEKGNIVICGVGEYESNNVFVNSVKSQKTDEILYTLHIEGINIAILPWQSDLGKNVNDFLVNVHVVIVQVDNVDLKQSPDLIENLAPNILVLWSAESVTTSMEDEIKKFFPNVQRLDKNLKIEQKDIDVDEVTESLVYIL